MRRPLVEFNVTPEQLEAIEGIDADGSDDGYILKTIDAGRDNFYGNN